MFSEKPHSLSRKNRTSPQTVRAYRDAVKVISRLLIRYSINYSITKTDIKSDDADTSIVLNAGLGEGYP